MADENVEIVPAAPVAAPAVQVPDRLSVPASALFSPDELAVSGDPSAAAAKPAETPAVPAEAPVVPAEPVAPAVPAEIPAAAPEKKIVAKVGNKEFTQAELEKALADRAQPKSAPAAAAPAAPAQTPKQPTPEEIAQAEGAWVDGFVKGEKLSLGFSNEEIETILSGGDEANKLFANKLNTVVAKAVMLARKSVYADMNPVLQDVQSRLTPLIGNAQEVQRAAAEQVFFTAYPDFKANPEVMQRARDVADALMARYPREFSGMTPQQQMEEVARQTNHLLQTEYKQWNPASTGTWRDALKPAAPVAAPAAASVPVGRPAAQPAAAPKPSVPAPAGNSPAGVPVGGSSPNWHKDTAKSLAD